MKLLLRRSVAALGLSFLCCLPLIGPLVSSGHRWMYHDRGSPASVILAVVLTLVAIWVFFTLLLLLAKRWGRMQIWLCTWLIVMTPWLVLKDVVLLFAWRFPHRLSVSLFSASVLCWVAVVGLWRPALLPLFDRSVRLYVTMFSFAGLWALLVVGELLWYLQAESMHTADVLHISPIQAVDRISPKPRIIWIILDELSYQQVYQERFPALDLPAFDRLARQSTVFTNVLPAAEYTDLAVPSLMTGLAVDDLSVARDDTLRSLHDPIAHAWHPYAPEDTVFHDAIGYGFRTAVAGWYNPYCRILPKVLDECFWVSRESTVGGMHSDASILSNMAAPWIYLVNKIKFLGHRGWQADEAGTRDHIADYNDLFSAGDRFLGDSSIGFLLLHMPVPHPGGLYDRRTQAFTTHRASYIDNLALADRYLAHVHELLDRRGEWDSSAVIVMGDHSWRTKLLWSSSQYWTAEDQAASHGGQFDDRPGYIVKLPFQTAAARVDGRFAAVRTRDLFDGILGGSIRSIPELAAFAQQNAAAPRQASR